MSELTRSRRCRVAAGAMLLGSLCLAAILLVSPAVGDGGSPSARGLGVAVALGDSFVSGEAGGWLGNAKGPGASENATNRLCRAGRRSCEPSSARVYEDGPAAKCRRSDVSAIETAPIAHSRRVNLACAGAVAADIIRPAEKGAASNLPSQAARLEALAIRDRVSLVVIAVGGNDIGFRELVVGCTAAWFATRSGGCRHVGNLLLRKRMAGFRNRVDLALDEVVSAMDRAGYSRGAWEFIVHGYASPIPSGDRYRYPEASLRRLLPGGCPFSDSDSDWVDEVLVAEMNRQLRRLARAHGAHFLDLSRAFDGHRVCEKASQLVGNQGPSPVTSEWFRYLVPCCGAEQRESLHPNAYGQRAIGSCLALLPGKPIGSWTCRNRPGAGPASMRLATASE